MARVRTTVDHTPLEGDYGNSVDGISVTCDRCHYTVECYGTEEASLNRCAVMLREECPLGQNNFYVVEDTFFVGELE